MGGVRVTLGMNEGILDAVSNRLQNEKPTFSDHQKDQILAVLGHYMSLELRHKIMAEAPLAYKAWMASRS